MTQNPSYSTTFDKRPQITTTNFWQAIRRIITILVGAYNAKIYD